VLLPPPQAVRTAKATLGNTKRWRDKDNINDL
jgi:hypothetical protein